VPLETIVFFLDRSLGTHIVAGFLRGAGAIVEVHADHFQSDAPDEDWLTEAGKRGWVVLTQDKRIRFREVEQVALHNAGVKAFIVTASRITGPEVGALLVKRLNDLVRMIEVTRGPFIALISREGIRLTRA
jgi:predicted nuclease of predicted toxin-antitoxin system